MGPVAEVARGAPPEGADQEWVKFTKRWKYGDEQRAAIKAVLDELLAPGG